jgi:hypothetical protein
MNQQNVMETHLFEYQTETESVEPVEFDYDDLREEFMKELLVSKEKFIKNLYGEMKTVNKSNGDLVPTIHFISGLDTVNRAYEDSKIKDTLVNESDDKYAFKITDLDLKDNYVCHAGYLHYLLLAWKHDVGIEIAPWHLYTVYLWQFIELITDNPDRYKDLIGNVNNKINIANDHFDPKEFANELIKKSKFFEKMVPEFQSSPVNYTNCIYGLMGHIAKNYYETWILSCSIPRVQVLGTKSDWQHLFDMALQVYTMFEPYLFDKYKNHFELTLEYFEEAIEKYTDQNFWSNFFNIDKCGSGSQKKISGDITKILLPKTHLLNEIPSQIARTEYTIDGKKGVYLTGLFYSELVDGILKPVYCQTNGSVTVEINEKSTPSPTTQFLAWMRKFHIRTNPTEMHIDRINEYMANQKKYIGIEDPEKVYDEISRDISYRLNIDREIVRKNLSNYIDLNKLDESIERTNNFRKQFNNNIYDYINFKTKERIEHIKECGSFWHQDDTFDESEYDSFRFLRLKLDRWLYYSPRLEKLFDLIKEHPNVLTDCGLDTDFLWKNHFIYCFYPALYDLFLDHTDMDFETMVKDILTNRVIDDEIRLTLVSNLMMNNEFRQKIALSVCKKLIYDHLPVKEILQPKFVYDHNEKTFQDKENDENELRKTIKFGWNSIEYENEVKKYKMMVNQKYANIGKTELHFDPDYLIQICEDVLLFGQEENYQYMKYIFFYFVLESHLSPDLKIQLNKTPNRVARMIEKMCVRKKGDMLGHNPYQFMYDNAFNPNHIYKNLSHISQRIFYNPWGILSDVSKKITIPLAFIPYGFNEILQDYIKERYSNNERHHNYDHDLFMYKVENRYNELHKPESETIESRSNFIPIENNLEDSNVETDSESASESFEEEIENDSPEETNNNSFEHNINCTLI